MRPTRAHWIVLPLAAVVAGCANTGRPSTAGSTGALSAEREESIRPGINKVYEDADVEVWKERFETEGREVYRERHRIVEAAGILPGMAVADIGAGTGLFVELFARAVGAAGTVYAVDIVPEFIAHLEQRATDAGLNNVTTVLCCEDSIELPAESIDLAFVCDTYHHFEYPASTLRSIHRALRPGGRLIVIDFERTEGRSREWVIKHVRAGKDVVIAETRAAGFEPVERSDLGFLDENYIIEFRKAE